MDPIPFAPPAAPIGHFDKDMVNRRLAELARSPGTRAMADTDKAG